jgi:hypothetical protein
MSHEVRRLLTWMVALLFAGAVPQPASADEVFDDYEDGGVKPEQKKAPSVDHRDPFYQSFKRQLDSRQPDPRTEIEGWLTYLDTYPDTVHAEVIRTRILELQEELDRSEGASEPAPRERSVAPAPDDESEPDRYGQDSQNSGDQSWQRESRSPTWRARYRLEVNRQARDWGITAAVMLPLTGGIALLGVAFGSSPYDDFLLYGVGLPHLAGFGLLGQIFLTTGASLGGIQLAITEESSRRAVQALLHRTRKGTGAAAIIFAIIAQITGPLSFLVGPLMIPVAVGTAIAAFTLLEVSSACLALVVEFEKLDRMADGDAPRAKRALARVMITPMGIVGRF